MKRTAHKKGFTIIELVIVVAVIGILTAVLIPTFVNLTNKAEVASHQSFLKNVNTQLAMRVGEGAKLNTANDAMEIADEMGFDVEKISPIDGNEIVYDNVAKRFALMKGDEVVYSDGGIKAEGVELWRIADSASKAAEINSRGNSIYAKETWNIGDLAEIHVGFDAGRNVTANSVSYARDATPGQTVILRTLGGSVAIDAPNDTVKHYASAAAVNIEAIASASYHEYGYVTYVEIKKGRAVAESEGVIETVLVTGTEVEIKEEDGGEINLAYAASEEISEALAETSDIPAPAVEPGVDVSNFVARTSNNGYETIEAAVAGAASGDTVVVLKDASIGDVVINKTLTLDGKGHTLTGTGFNTGKDKKTGASGIDVRGGGQAITATLKDMTITETGNLAVINVERADENDRVKLVVDGVSMNKFYGYGIRPSRGSFEIKDSVIDCTAAPRATRNGVSILADTGHPVTGSVVGTKIVGAFKEGKWADSGIAVFGECALTVDKCDITECLYGISFSTMASAQGNQSLRLTNTKISAESPIYFYSAAYCNTTTFNIGAGNHIVSTIEDGWDIEGYYGETSVLNLAVDTTGSVFEDAWVLVLYGWDSSLGDWVYDAERSIYVEK